MTLTRKLALVWVAGAAQVLCQVNGLIANSLLAIGNELAGPEEPPAPELPDWLREARVIREDS